MSPIEIDVWEMLNSVGAKMYPQYPVAGFFLDFASPHAKVGIECDGKMWHQDRERDARRDSILREAGWSIWRFSGTEIRRAYHANDYDEDGPTQTEMLNEVMAWLSHETGRKHA
jgi:very-short-patch-repair endonuclease